MGAFKGLGQAQENGAGSTASNSAPHVYSELWLGPRLNRGWDGPAHGLPRMEGMPRVWGLLRVLGKLGGAGPLPWEGLVSGSLEVLTRTSHRQRGRKELYDDQTKKH